MTEENVGCYYNFVHVNEFALESSVLCYFLASDFNASVGLIFSIHVSLVGPSSFL